MKAGAVAGLPYGLGFSMAMVWLTFSGSHQLMSELPPSVTASEAEIAVFGFILIFALLVSSFLGLIVGFIFVKLINRIPVVSVYVKAVGFGFILWLPSFLLFLLLIWLGPVNCPILSST